MATTGLYSQHLNNRKKLHARNAVIALLLVLFAVLALFPIFYMIWPRDRYCGQHEVDIPFKVDA